MYHSDIVLDLYYVDIVLDLLYYIYIVLESFPLFVVLVFCGPQEVWFDSPQDKASTGTAEHLTK